ncbi:MAG: hypothetical protein WC677_08225 [Clostridia bacterium]|jgi:hypothetical protein
MDIELMLEMLANGEICLDLFDMVDGFANIHVKNPKNLHHDTVFTPSDYASDFILYLKGNLGAQDIGTKNDLRRLFRKWITINNNPERHELWGIISEALLALEKEGKCERLPEYKAYNNGNSTIWFSPGFKGKQHNPDIYEDKKRDIPTFSPMKIKAHSKKMAKIITPESAKKLVVLLIESVKGEITMSRLVDYAANHVVLNPYRKKYIRGQDNDSEEDNETANAKSVAIYVYIEEEAENKADIIWSLLSRRNNAHKVLCLYIIPKYILNYHVKLGDFGQSAKTIDSIKTDVFDVLRENFHLDRLSNTSSDEELNILKEVVGKTIEIINSKCSENGYDPSLLTNRDKPKQ